MDDPLCEIYKVSCSIWEQKKKKKKNSKEKFTEFKYKEFNVKY